ncbi:kinase [Sphingomonas oleivorans]|uniref:Kinase n=1 Tax=Sphingomonas oleivorans TaxID=1735121 RepID=A0A2T5FYI4_9SPHN|nr:allophanate hydrolase subunit 1 [Sphingomonas oleivorans]PTQ11575.1 kinase [Sphingomonas oleivorans]
MTTIGPSFPRLRAVGDSGLLVEFGDRIDKAVHNRLLAFDAALQADPFIGFTEAVPAYASILVGYDPLLTEPSAVEAHVARLLDHCGTVDVPHRLHELAVCYDREFAPDLPALAERAGLSVETAIAAHLAGDYRVFLYGFAPGYAYLGGVPEAIRLPRKAEPVRDVPAGSLIVAGPQCIVTTLTMPTGWWIIGRSPTPILRAQAERPFLFDVGDRVRFRRIDRAEYERLAP